MGVPKFFRWLSERYPLINQRYHAPSPDSNQDNNEEKKRNNLSLLSDSKDVLGGATLAPEIDRLYIDMNGIIHGCSHNNNATEDDGANAALTEEQIFDNITFYLDRVIGDVVQPKEVVYMAIDGVAPRAKLNQQRSRRYRSSTGQEIEQTVYEAHLNHMARQRKLEEEELLDNDGDVQWRSSYEDHVLEEDYDPEVGPLPSSGQWQTLKKSTSGTGGANSASKSTNNTSASSDNNPLFLTEVEPGRFAGKFETHVDTHAAENSDNATTNNATNNTNSITTDQTTFHSNAITPGTPFFQRCVDHLEGYLRDRLANHPKWKHLTIVFSGPNVPGEGEHKIMDFMRHQKQDPNYDPNLRHCIMGQDGDLIMLGLCTHEPNLVLLREQVIFKAERRRALEGMGVQAYVHNPNFEFLHMNVLRDYLAFDFETSNVVVDSPFDLERTIDDFVFMTFFVGNDFLPSIPALDIADEAFDLLWYTYREQRQQWYEESKTTGVQPYLTHAGNIVSGKRLEQFLSQVGSFESPYYDNKKEDADNTNKRIRKIDQKYGMETLPSDDVLQSKEEADRARFREMMWQSQQQYAAAAAATGVIVDKKNTEKDKDSNSSSNSGSSSFTPVLSSPEPTTQFQPSQNKEDERLDAGMTARLGNLLQKSFTPQPQTSTKKNVDSNSSDSSSTKNTDADTDAAFLLDDQDLKGRYYFDKFQFTPFDKEKHQALRKAYIEGLVWNLKYYYEGVASWDWYYPYHYGPMLSDLKNIDDMLEEISFEGKLGEPLQPFEQLLACMPPSQSHMLPEPYRWLMSNPTSPLAQYYPKTFTVDMNGKRWPWEAVVLLPFIDTQHLLKYSRRVGEDLLSHEEMERNKQGHALVLSHDSVRAARQRKEDRDAVRIEPFEQSTWDIRTGSRVAFQPSLAPETVVPLPGLPTLKAAPIRSLWRRRLGVDVFGLRSRYKTACLEHSTAMPTLPPLDALGRSLIGSCIFINYPHLTEAFVTAVSNETHVIRGKDNKTKRWSKKEAMAWTARIDSLTREYAKGQGFTGTGGLILSDNQEIILSVRPFQGLKEMPDGTVVKTFAKTEVEVPIVAAMWAPRQTDPRLSNIPARLEKDPYKYANARGSVSSKANGKQSKSSKSASKVANSDESLSEVLLTPVEDTSGEKTHRAAPYEDFSVLPGYEKQNGNASTVNGSSVKDVMNGSKRGKKSKRKKRQENASVEDILPLSPSHDEAWLPLDDTEFPTKKLEAGVNPRYTNTSFGTATENSSQPSSLSESQYGLESDPTAGLPDEIRVVNATGRKWWEQPPKPDSSSSRSFSTASLTRAGVRKPTMFQNSFHKLQTSRSTRSFATGTFRTRAVVTLGVAAATFFFAPLTEAALFELNTRQLPVLSHNLNGIASSIDVRGGDQDLFGEVRDSERSRSPPPLEFDHGTTTLSFTFQGGAIVAVDSRASQGNFVGSKTVQKVLPINSHILGTMAGGAADCSILMRKLLAEAQLYELEKGRRMSPARVSRILSNILYGNRNLGLSVGTMILGFDDDNSDNSASSPAKIFYVDNSGVRIPGEMFSAGSGSTFALAILDTEHRYNMTEKEAIALGIKAIRYATFRDAFSGGFINVYLITNTEGWKKVFTEDVAALTRSQDATEVLKHDAFKAADGK